MRSLRRAFISVVPPADVLDAIAARVAPLQTDRHLRWTGPAQWHTTLCFLGGIADPAALVGALGAPVASVTAFVMRLGGAGAFPDARRATVLWLGVQSGQDRVSELADVVTGATASPTPTGLPTPTGAGPYRPHLTLGRTSRPRDVGGLVTAIGGDPVGREWTVAEVVVMESDTRSDGAVYTEVARVPLRDSG